MKKYILATCILIGSLWLSACTVSSNSTVDNESKESEPVPLNLILDALKGELRAVNKTLSENPNEFAFSCNNNVTPADVFFKAIIVDLHVTQSGTGRFGADAELKSGSGFSLRGSASQNESSSHSNTVTLYLKPEITSHFTEKDKLKKGGIGDILTQTMLQLIASDDTRPCLNIGYEGANSLKIRIEFKTEKVRTTEGGISFVVLQVDGEEAKSNAYSHTLTAKIDIRQKPKQDRATPSIGTTESIE